MDKFHLKVNKIQKKNKIKAFKSKDKDKKKNKSNEKKTLYPKNPKIGLVIGTHGSEGFIRLQLASRKKNYPDIPVLVHDDSSSRGSQLKKICDSHKNVEFISTPYHYGWCPGDVNALLFGLNWAVDNNIDILVKFSRRFIPLVSFSDELLRIAKKSQCPTFSNICHVWGYGFRTEAYAVSTKAWLNRLDIIKETIDYHVNRGRHTFFVEPVIHSWAVETYNEYKHLVNKDFKGYGKGFARWNLLTNYRCRKNDMHLWHHSNHINDYKSMANKLGVEF